MKYTLMDLQALFKEPYPLLRNHLEKHFNPKDGIRTFKEWLEIFDALNATYELGLKQGDRMVFAKIYAGLQEGEGLQYTRRYGIDPTIREAHENSSATHSILTALCAADFFAKAYPGSSMTDSIKAQRTKMILGAIVHDADEYDGEPLTEIEKMMGIQAEPQENRSFEELYRLARHAVQQAYPQAEFAYCMERLQPLCDISEVQGGELELDSRMLKLFDKIQGNETMIRFSIKNGTCEPGECKTSPKGARIEHYPGEKRLNILNYKTPKLSADQLEALYKIAPEEFIPLLNQMATRVWQVSMTLCGREPVTVTSPEGDTQTLAQRVKDLLNRTQQQPTYGYAR